MPSYVAATICVAGVAALWLFGLLLACFAWVMHPPVEADQTD